MECNKDEAFRAKEIAEKKFRDRDIVGAKIFAIKAQNLFPALDGLPQFLATLDVYVTVEKRTDGETDWYRVLGVEPFADYDTIQKHYRKLALMLHPDKNKSVGADGAFKIISEAWNLLSDKAKKIAYDQKWNLRDMDENVPNWKTSMPTSRNGFHVFSNSSNSYVRTKTSSVHPQPPSPAHFSKPNTFWTICNACRTQFEYLRNYLNHRLLCQNCRKVFFAVEMTPIPVNGNGPPLLRNSYMQNYARHMRMENSYNLGKQPTSTTNMGPVAHSDVFFKAGIGGSVPSAAQTENLRRKHGEPHATVVREFLQRPMKTGLGLTTGSYVAVSGSIPRGDGLKKRRRIDKIRADKPGSLNFSFEVRRGYSAENRKPNSTKELSQPELRNMLMEKAKKGISAKLKGWSTTSTVSKILEKEMERKEKERQKAGLKDMQAEAGECPKVLNSKTRSCTNMPSPANSDIDPEEGIDSSAMMVPDPDFHDFDNDRAEKSFGYNQVWVAYDDDDGMPRYYAMIHSVISQKQFKMRMSWLNTKNNREFGPLNWIGSGFYKTSGDFWIGKHEVYKTLTSFSHKVRWTKGTRGTIHIYPGKGDVWALYRNWSPEWNQITLDDIIHKYDMVEVLEDYSEEKGVTVTPLVKVPGFKTLFRRHSDASKTRTIPREEMFRFSHQVPSYLLTGQEGPNAPKGCWELDPASTPLELLQVLTEAQVEEMLQTTAKAKEKEPFGDAFKFKEEKVVPNGNTTKEKVVPNGNTTKEKGVLQDAAREGTADATEKRGKEAKLDMMMVYKQRR